MTWENPSLSDVVERRRSLQSQIEKLRAEDLDLALAEKVLVGLLKTPAAASPFAPQPRMRVRTVNSQEINALDGVTVSLASGVSKSLTTEEMIVGALGGSANPWWTSGRLKEYLSQISGRDIPMGTVGPTLSMMKGRGSIVRDGFKVALAERVPDHVIVEGDLEAVESEVTPTAAEQFG